MGESTERAYFHQSPSPSDTILAKILKRLDDLTEAEVARESRFMSMEKAIWSFSSFASSINDNLKALKDRMEVVEKFALASSLDVSPFFPLGSKEMVEELRKEITKDAGGEFKIALVSSFDCLETLN